MNLPILRLHRTGELERRGEELWSMMKGCTLCPRECGTDRSAGRRGADCRASERLEVASRHLPWDTYLKLMSQYQPMCKAVRDFLISRALMQSEYAQAVERARQAGLTNLEIQGYRY